MPDPVFWNSPLTLPLLFQTVFGMGFLNLDQEQIELSHQGRIYIACTLPLTLVVLGASFTWIWWTGKKER